MKIDKKKPQTIAYLDAEYTCPTGNELLSIGVIICDSNNNELERLYTIVKPVNCLISDFCTNLTGITQMEAEKGLSYKEAFENLYLLLKQYNVKKIYVWGNDSVVLKNDLEKNHIGLSQKTTQHVLWIIKHIKDVSGVYSHKLGLSLTSLEKMKFVCGNNEPVKHHALSDAVDLKNISVSITNKSYNEKRRVVLNNYMQEHRRYNTTKRFSLRQDFKDTDKKSKKAAISYMKTLNLEIPELRALHDDLSYLYGLKCAKGFPSFKEYVKKHAPNI